MGLFWLAISLSFRLCNWHTFIQIDGVGVCESDRVEDGDAVPVPVADDAGVRVLDNEGVGVCDSDIVGVMVAVRETDGVLDGDGVAESEIDEDSVNDVVMVAVIEQS